MPLVGSKQYPGGEGGEAREDNLDSIFQQQGNSNCFTWESDWSRFSYAPAI